MPEVTSDSSGLAVTIGDSTTGEVVGRKFDGDAIPGQHPDVVGSHLPGEMAKNGMPVFELDAEHGIRQCIDDFAIHRNCIGILAARSLLNHRARSGCGVTNWLTICGFLWQSISPVFTARHRRPCGPICQLYALAS